MPTGDQTTYTTNYHLIKPGYNSPSDIDDLNSNMDIIDEALHDIGDVNNRVSISTVVNYLGSNPTSITEFGEAILDYASSSLNNNESSLVRVPISGATNQWDNNTTFVGYVNKLGSGIITAILTNQVSQIISIATYQDGSTWSYWSSKELKDQDSVGVLGDANTVTSTFGIVDGSQTGYDSTYHWPSGIGNRLGIFIQKWVNRSNTGDTTQRRVQTVISDNGYVFSRKYDNNTFSSWESVSGTSVVITSATLDALKSSITTTSSGMNNDQSRLLKITTSFADDNFRNGGVYSGYLTKISSGLTVNLVGVSGDHIDIGYSNSKWSIVNLRAMINPSEGINSDISDCNSPILGTTIRRIINSTQNRPSGIDYGVLLSSKVTNNYISQIAFGIGNNFAMRSYSSGSWQPWLLVSKPTQITKRVNYHSSEIQGSGSWMEISDLTQEFSGKCVITVCLHCDFYSTRTNLQYFLGIEESNRLMEAQYAANYFETSSGGYYRYKLDNSFTFVKDNTSTNSVKLRIYLNTGEYIKYGIDSSESSRDLRWNGITYIYTPF